jgi:hypothetical protein
MFDISMKPSRVSLRSQRGSGGVAIVLAIFSFVSVLGAVYISGKVLESAKVLENESLARTLTEVMVARASQAVAGNAINCAKATSKCTWNANMDKDEFGFSKVTQDGLKLIVEGDVCMNPESMTDPNCHKQPMTAVLSIANLQDLISNRLITGTTEPGDYDTHGVLVESNALYMVSAASDNDSTGSIRDPKGGQRVYTRTVVIRRPRAFLRIESDPGFCTVGCSPPLGNNPAPPCYSPPQFTGTDSQAGVVNVRVKNDGPGYVYGFKINRLFEPDPFFNTTPASLAPRYGALSGDGLGVVKVYDSASEGLVGLGPGEEFSFSDTLPCFTEVRALTVQLGPGGVPGPPTNITASMQKTGRVVYSFEPLTLDPDNMLIISRAGTSIPAALSTNMTYLIPPDPTPTPTPPVTTPTPSVCVSTPWDPSCMIPIDPGPDSSGGLGGDGDGCDGGGGCDGA